MRIPYNSGSSITYWLKWRVSPFTFRHLPQGRGIHLLANLTLLFFFASAFSVFSELYEFISKYMMGYQFDSSGFDTWLDIMANMAGAGYVVLRGMKSQVTRNKNQVMG